MTPPPFLGGQGREPESLIATAGTLFWTALGFVVVVAVLVLRGCR